MYNENQVTKHMYHCHNDTEPKKRLKTTEAVTSEGMDDNTSSQAKEQQKQQEKKPAAKLSFNQATEAAVRDVVYTAIDDTYGVAWDESFDMSTIPFGLDTLYVDVLDDTVADRGIDVGRKYFCYDDDQSHTSSHEGLSVEGSKGDQDDEVEEETSNAEAMDVDEPEFGRLEDGDDLPYCFKREASRTYFENMKEGRALEELVRKAVYHDVEMPVSHQDIVETVDVARLAFHLTKDERDQLSTVIRNEHKRSGGGYEEYDTYSPPLFDSNAVQGVEATEKARIETQYQEQLRVPPLDTPQKIRSTIMEGKYAFVPSLAHPPVGMLDSKHAYVSPVDWYAHLIAEGLAFDEIEMMSVNTAVTEISQSLAAQKLLEKFPGIKLHLWHDWSDDCEPNYSIKTNRGSIWIKTITFCPPCGCKDKSR